MKRHGKKKHSWIDIIFRYLILLSIISILLLCKLLSQKDAETPGIWEDKVPEVVNPENKDYNIHILTSNELSTLYSYDNNWTIVSTNITDIVEIDYNEAQLFMKICRAEGGDGLLGQLWVMRVIINRVNSDVFPNTITEVITDTSCGIQFETYVTGTYEDAEINANSHMALAMLESGWDETDGALYFESTSNSDNSWHAKQCKKGTLQYIKEVEGNKYYK